MKLIIFIILIQTCLSFNDQLAFIFELDRHGSRGPKVKTNDYFQYGEQQLTPVGMRQRMFVGKMNRERIINQYNLLNQKYKQEEIQIYSTDKFRTIQSIYSELLGMYTNDLNELKEGEKQSFRQGKALPPIYINEKILQKFNQSSLPPQFVQIPVYEYHDQEIEDDASYESCQYLYEMEDYYWNQDPDTFDDIQQPFFDVLLNPITIAFNLSNNKISFQDLWDYIDCILCEATVGEPLGYNFTQEEWSYMLSAQKYAYSLRFDDYGKQLFMSKLLRRPLFLMKSRLNTILRQDQQDTKFLVYSAHEDEIIIMLDFLEPAEFNLSYIQTASQLHFELHYDQDCLNSNSSKNSCFWVEIILNGQSIYFQDCIDKNLHRQDIYFDKKFCFYDDFIEYIDSKILDGDFDLMCNQKFEP